MSTGSADLAKSLKDIVKDKRDERKDKLQMNLAIIQRSQDNLSAMDRLNTEIKAKERDRWMTMYAPKYWKKDSLDNVIGIIPHAKTIEEEFRIAESQEDKLRDYALIARDEYRDSKNRIIALRDNLESEYGNIPEEFMTSGFPKISSFIDSQYKIDLDAQEEAFDKLESLATDIKSARSAYQAQADYFANNYKKFASMDDRPLELSEEEYLAMKDSFVEDPLSMSSDPYGLYGLDVARRFDPAKAAALDYQFDEQKKTEFINKKDVIISDLKSKMDSNYAVMSQVIANDIESIFKDQSKQTQKYFASILALGDVDHFLSQLDDAPREIRQALVNTAEGALYMKQIDEANRVREHYKNMRYESPNSLDELINYNPAEVELKIFNEELRNAKSKEEAFKLFNQAMKVGDHTEADLDNAFNIIEDIYGEGKDLFPDYEAYTTNIDNNKVDDANQRVMNAQQTIKEIERIKSSDRTSDEKIRLQDARDIIQEQYDIHTATENEKFKESFKSAFSWLIPSNPVDDALENISQYNIDEVQDSLHKLQSTDKDNYPELGRVLDSIKNRYPELTRLNATEMEKGLRTILTQLSLNEIKGTD